MWYSPATHLYSEQALSLPFLPYLWQQRQDDIHKGTNVLTKPLNDEVEQAEHLTRGDGKDK